MTLTVAIVGRPNVGKSTLFNRLTGKRTAIVHDLPGVTRDRREGKGTLVDLDLRLIDTAGLEDADPASLEGRMRLQTDAAIAEADVVLMMIDARAGVTPLDRHFADALRRVDKPVVLVANKCEGAQAGLYEGFALGLGEPVPLSAEHGEGLADLFAALAPFADAMPPETTESEPAAQPPLSLAVVGRPNVGKSTLVNRLLGAGTDAHRAGGGITRDAISIAWTWRDRPVVLVDTAGLRRKARIEESLEKLSTRDTMNAVRMANVVALVLDVGAALEKQDLTIARHVIDEGRALVIAVNKWDAATDKTATLAALNERLARTCPRSGGILAVPLSALRGQGLDRLMTTVFSLYDTWNRRVPTRPLNDWLAGMLERNLPPLSSLGRRLRIRYITQVKTRPPTFAAFASRPGELPDPYIRFLINGLRDAFDLDGVPIRLMLRTGKNPYADNK